MTYEYECKGCGKTVEIEQSIKEEPIRVCPLCGSDLIRRLISKCAFVLNGTGWPGKEISKRK